MPDTTRELARFEVAAALAQIARCSGENRARRLSNTVLDAAGGGNG